MSKSMASVLVFSALAGCAASTPTASSPKNSGSTDGEGAAVAPVARAPESVAVEEAPPADNVQAEESTALEIPSVCAPSDTKICTPPSPFVAKLCQSKSPDVALSMFRKSTPWTRVYVRRETDAWYMGARHSSPVKLLVHEEVIVVASRSGGSSGIQVSGSGSYDVYRWDGQCVSIMADEVSVRRPSIPESAAIAWNSLTEATRQALLDDRAIKSRYDQQRDRCSADSNAPRCTDATTALMRLITDYVRRGGKVPEARLATRTSPAR